MYRTEVSTRANSTYLFGYLNTYSFASKSYFHEVLLPIVQGDHGDHVVKLPAQHASAAIPTSALLKLNLSYTIEYRNK